MRFVTRVVGLHPSRYSLGPAGGKSIASLALSFFLLGSLDAVRMLPSSFASVAKDSTPRLQPVA
jgi:hypothetical protein